MIPLEGLKQMMKNRIYVTLALTLLLFSSSVFIGLSPNVIEKRGAHFGSSDLVTGEDNWDVKSRFAGGSGTEDDPYQISNVSQLQDMNLDLSANYILLNDIDASETRDWNNDKGFSPIAKYTMNETNKFSGKFDGKGLHITGLYLNWYSGYHIGLFAHIKNNGHISNISLIDCSVNGNTSVGGLVGENSGMVQNCYVTGNVTGNYNVGGLIGINDYGSVQNCFATGNVSGNRYVGGLVGSNYHGKVLNCSASGTSYGRVIPNSSGIGTDTGGDSTSGLIGYNKGIVQNCSATGTITGGDDVGGLVGENRGTIQNSYATVTVTGTHSVGGLVGENDGTVKNCSATGNISGVQFIGGLVGENGGTLQSCYATGNMRGYWDVGGFVGLNKEIIKNSFYCINSTTINQKNVITTYGIYRNQFDQWLGNGKTLDIDDYLSKIVSSDYYNIGNTSDIKNLLPFAAFDEYKFTQTADIDMSSEPNLHIPIWKGSGHRGLFHFVE